MQSETSPNTAPQSLCCGVCKLDTSGGYCLGCFRSREEIGAWSRASNTEKQAINQAAQKRAQQISAAVQQKKDNK